MNFIFMNSATFPNSSVDFPKLKAIKELKSRISTKNRSTGDFIKPNGRSADFCLSIAHGCLLGCSYCYVQRHNLNGNPLTMYSNKDELFVEILKHYNLLSTPKPSTFKPCDSKYPSGESDLNNYTYDIGESVDVLLKVISSDLNWWLDKLISLPYLKPTFATKISTPAAISRLMDCPVPRKARIRASVAPQNIIDQTEIMTAKVTDRIAGLNLAYEKGYECHLNFSPVIVTPTWVEDYSNLMILLDQLLSPEVKKQLHCEVIFLLHHTGLSEWNRKHFPLDSESLLWTPQNQEFKTNGRGYDVKRYKWQLKSLYVSTFKQLLSKYMPYCRIRYIF